MEFRKYLKNLDLLKLPNNDYFYQKEMDNLHSLNYPRKDNLTVAQKEAIKDIIENGKLIAQILAPLKYCGLNLSLSLVGGAVRDMATNNSEKISDYDFIISLKDPNDYYTSFEKNNLKRILGEEVINGIYERFNINYEDTKREEYRRVGLNQEIFKILVENIISESIDNVEIINEKNMKESDQSLRAYFINNFIKTLFKIDGIKGKRIDLISSSINGFEYIKQFDFELCKGEINFDILIENPKKNLAIEHAIDNLWISPGMLRDINDKTISIEENKFPLNLIKHFCENHYPRIKEKYSNYNLNTICTKEPNKNSSIYESLMKGNNYLQSFILSEKLQKDLSINNESSVTPKVKI
jgi:hypothetical protein